MTYQRQLIIYQLISLVEKIFNIREQTKVLWKDKKLTDKKN